MLGRGSDELGRGCDELGRGSNELGRGSKGRSYTNSLEFKRNPVGIPVESMKFWV